MVAATSYAGFAYSQNLQQRIWQLNNLKKIFTAVYSDVEYGACTLVESFERISNKQEVLFQDFLKRICCGMKKDSTSNLCMPFYIIFSEAIDSQLKESALHDSDKEDLIQLGKQLGNEQRKGQMRIIQMYLQDLDVKVAELEKSRQEKQKLSRILGISSGVLIVILLL